MESKGKKLTLTFGISAIYLNLFGIIFSGLVGIPRNKKQTFNNIII